jgi:hypothetical protein
MWYAVTNEAVQDFAGTLCGELRRTGIEGFGRRRAQSFDGKEEH